MSIAGYMTNAEKRERLNLLNEEEWLRWAYVPFCIAEGAWDYADTVINLSAQMDIGATKKLCRTIRELKRSYNSKRQRYAMTRSGYELDNFQVFENTYPKGFKFMYDCIGQSIDSRYPDLENDYRALLTAVYACTCIIKVLFKYQDIQDSHVRKVCGFAEMSSILPDELTKLRRLMPEFAGDKRVKIKGVGLFIHNTVSAFCRVDLTNGSEQRQS